MLDHVTLRPSRYFLPAAISPLARDLILRKKNMPTTDAWKTTVGTVRILTPRNWTLYQQLFHFYEVPFSATIWNQFYDITWWLVVKRLPKKKIRLWNGQEVVGRRISEPTRQKTISIFMATIWFLSSQHNGEPDDSQPLVFLPHWLRACCVNHPSATKSTNSPQKKIF